MIPAGTVVHSYLFHYNPTAATKLEGARITFDDEILGVSVGLRTLLGSDFLAFANPNLGGAGERRMSVGAGDDSWKILEDRRTIVIDLKGGGGTLMFPSWVSRVQGYSAESRSEPSPTSRVSTPDVDLHDVEVMVEGPDGRFEALCDFAEYGIEEGDVLIRIPAHPLARGLDVDAEGLDTAGAELDLPQPSMGHSEAEAMKH